MTDAEEEAIGMKEQREREEAYREFIRQRQAVCKNHDGRL